MHTRGCPCDKFKQVFGMEPRTLHHYTAQSRNVVRDVDDATTRGHANSDLYLPPAVLEALHVVYVGGDPARYRFRRLSTSVGTSSIQNSRR